MADIYTKLGEKTVVHAVREGRGRKFGLGEWTEARGGMFVSAIAATGHNDVAVAETLAVSTVADNITFGLKDDSDIIPGEAGSLFLGVKQSSATVSSNGGGAGGISSSGSDGTVAIGYSGATAVAGVGAINGLTIGLVNGSGAAPYATFLGIQLIITNLGLATQSVAIRCNTTTAISDYSATNLRELLNNTNWTGIPQATVAWNDGAAAYDIPDCLFVRCPLYLNVIRRSCWRIIRYAP